MTSHYRFLILAVVGLLVFSCNESPTIDFHSYQELSEYSFIRNGWFPEILNEDATLIKETYDVNNKHVFGKFDFSDRIQYDSIIGMYARVERDTLIAKIDEIDKPLYPEWFISKNDLNTGNYIAIKQNSFYLIIEKKINRIYYFR